MDLERIVMKNTLYTVIIGTDLKGNNLYALCLNGIEIKWSVSKKYLKTWWKQIINLKVS